MKFLHNIVLGKNCFVAGGRMIDGRIIIMVFHNKEIFSGINKNYHHLKPHNIMFYLMFGRIRMEFSFFYHLISNIGIKLDI